MRKKEILQGLLLFLTAFLLLKFFYTYRSLPWITRTLPILSATVLLYFPLIFLTLKREPIDFIDRTAQEWKRSLSLFALVVIVVMPLFLLGAHSYEKLFFHRGYHPAFFYKPVIYFSFQLFLVALPEEFFFRGWLQSFLNKHFSKKWRLLGTPFGLSLPLTALIFAFSHSLITLQWWHFSIFFPALLFGWLREKTGSITTPILFHATSNFVNKWIELHYL